MKRFLLFLLKKAARGTYAECHVNNARDGMLNQMLIDQLAGVSYLPPPIIVGTAAVVAKT